MKMKGIDELIHTIEAFAKENEYIELSQEEFDNSIRAYDHLIDIAVSGGFTAHGYIAVVMEALYTAAVAHRDAMEICQKIDQSHLN